MERVQHRILNLGSILMSRYKYFSQILHLYFESYSYIPLYLCVCVCACVRSIALLDVGDDNLGHIL